VYFYAIYYALLHQTKSNKNMSSIMKELALVADIISISMSF